MGYKMKQYNKNEIINIIKKMKDCLNNNSNEFFELHFLLYNIMYGDTDGRDNYLNLNESEINSLLDFVYDLDYVDQDIFDFLGKNINTDFYISEKKKMLALVNKVLQNLENK